MTRSEAWEILNKHIKDKRLINHCLAAEATMRGLANYFGENEEIWGITGLMHDADYEESKGHPEKHGLLLFQTEKNIPDDIKHAIQSHNYDHTNVIPTTRMDWAITCCDQLTGLIVACALVSPSHKLADLTNDFIIKKMKQPKFAAGANRTKIYMCEEKLGIPLIEFVTIALTNMQKISDELGL